MAADDPASAKRLKVLAWRLHQLGATCATVGAQLAADAGPPSVVGPGWTSSAAIARSAAAPAGQDVMCLVYEAPPSDITWGLVRDTGESIVDAAPWPSSDETVLYYYLLDLQENRVSASVPHPGAAGTLAWHGDRHRGLPQRLSDIPAGHRYTPPAPVSPVRRDNSQDRRVVNEPRRYADPF